MPPLTGGDRRLALNAGQQYEALIGYYVNRDISKDDRTLALNSANRYLANVEFIVGRDISAADRRLALNANNRYVSTIDQLIGKKITGDDRKLALNSTNAYLTTVDAVLKRGIPADVRTFGLANSNAIMTTVDGILASGMSGDVRTLALKSSNRFVTTLEAALKDGRITGDERKLLDARSEDVIKTLKTSGSLNLTQDEWAVINAASGTQRLQLLADVAFGRTDLDHLKGIDDNTDSLEQKAREQLTSLQGLVSEMSRTTNQFVSLNTTMISLRDSINALGVAQAEIARIERERAGAELAAQAQVLIDRRQGYTDNRGDLQSQLRAAQNQNVSGLQSQLRQYERELANGPTTTQSVRNEKYAGWSNSHLREAFGGLPHDLYVNRTVTDTARINELRHLVSSTEGQIAHQQQQNASRVAEITQQLNAATGAISGFNEQLKQLRADYRATTGQAAPFATGGIFEYGRVVDTSTRFNIGEMGEAGPEMILPVEKMSNGKYGMQARLAFDMPPLPRFPLLGNNDVLETLRDLKREIAELRRDNARLQSESNQHLAVANNQRGAAAKGQIDAVERGNKMLKRMEDDKRLEAAKR